MSNSSVNAELVIRIKDGTAQGSAAVVKTAQKTAQDAATAFDRAAARSAAAAERAAQRSAASVERSAARQQLSQERASQRSSIAAERAAAAAERFAVRQQLSQERAAQRAATAAEHASRRSAAAAESAAARCRAAAEKAAQAEEAAAKRAASAWEKSHSDRRQQVIRGGAIVVAGGAAGAYALKAPAMEAMSFDERLARMANTAYAERDKSGRIVGKAALEQAINTAVGKGGGGTREQAAEALDSMIASGAMSSADAIKMLPQIMRFSSGEGADPTQLANIGIRAMQTFKIAPEEMPKVMNMAIASGQAGGFELRDMAKWLPQQMAAATMSGMTGREGFAKLAALNQAAAITAGSKDEAGNNVVNLLAKINSRDTATDAKRIGIDLPKYLQDRRAKGVDSVDAFAELVDQSVAGRADYKALQTKLAAAKNDGEKREALESMATIAQGAGIGELVQDRQAMMALLGMMNNRQYMADVMAKVRANDVSTGGAGDKNYDLVSETPAFLLRQAAQNKDAGQKAAMDSLTPAIGAAAEAFGDLAQKYPLLTGVTTLATGAIAAMGAAAGVTAMVMGGKLPGGLLSRIFSAGGGAVLAETAAGAAGVAAGAGGAAPAAATGVARFATLAHGSAALAPLAAMYSMSEWAGDTSKDKERIDSRQAVGGALETVLGWFGFDKAGDIEARRVANRAELGGDDRSPEVNATLTVALAPGLVLTNQAVQASGRVTMNTGNLNGVPG